MFNLSRLWDAAIASSLAMRVGSADCACKAISRRSGVAAMAGSTDARIGIFQSDNCCSLDIEFAAGCSTEIAEGGDAFLTTAEGESETADRSSGIEPELLKSSGVDFSIAEVGAVQAAAARDLVTQFSFSRKPHRLRHGNTSALGKSLKPHTVVNWSLSVKSEDKRFAGDRIGLCALRKLRHWLGVGLAFVFLGVAALEPVYAQSLPNGGSVSGAIVVPRQKVTHSFFARHREGIQLRLVDTGGSSTFIPDMTVYRPDGSKVNSYLDSDVASARFTADATGTYTVVVGDSDFNRPGTQTGAYELHFVRAPGANEHNTLTNGGVRTGTIDKGDLDSYTLFANQGEGIQLRLVDTGGSSTFIPEMTVYRPNGLVVNSYLDSDVASARFTADATGTYTVVVGDSDFNRPPRSSGAYALHFIRAPGANEHGTLINDGVRRGTIGKGDLDSYTLFANRGEGIQLRLVDTGGSSTFIPDMTVYRPNGSVVNSYLGADVASAQFSADATGAYTVVVGDSDFNRPARGSGAYSLALTTVTSTARFSYAALGDSYSSGEGVLPFRDLGDTALDGCHRSTRAYATKIRRSGSASPIAQRDDSRFDFFACTGAVTDNVRADGNPHPNGEPPQMAIGNAINASRDLVTISIGGNDAQFVPLFGLCMLLPECHEIRPFAPHSSLTLADFAPLLLAYTAVKVADVHLDLSVATPNAATIVVGYPILFSGDECSALQFPPFGSSDVKISASEQVFLRDLNAKVNKVVETSAALAGLHFVSVAERFAGHEICGSQGAWINGVVLFNPTWNPKASVHPTARGQQEYANAINGYLQSIATGWPHGYLPNGMPKNPPSRIVPPAPGRQPSAPPAALPELGDLDIVLTTVPEDCLSARGVVVPGEAVRLRGAGYQAGEHIDVAVIVAGQIRTIGSGLSGTDGSLNITVTIPADATPGTLLGVQALGAGRSGAGRLLFNSVRVESSSVLDGDEDGVPDICDNCTKVANADQRDTDRDGYGNVCDGDLDNNGVVNTLDLALFRASFGKREGELDADLDGNFVVNTLDLGIFKSLFGKAPGPAFTTDISGRP
jgi:hypothetical protein